MVVLSLSPSLNTLVQALMFCKDPNEATLSLIC